MKRWAIVAVALVTGALEASAACDFDKMLRVVYRDVTPGVPRDSFAAKPKTLYRVGTRYGRVEEAPDPDQGIHGLVIVNEPDVWMVNLIDKSAKHIVDRGDTTDFHAPILWTDDMPADLKRFEFGCELQFMKEIGAHKERVEVQGEKKDKYTLVRDKYRVALFVGVKDRLPKAVVVQAGERVIHAIRYEIWEHGLEPKLDLFEAPNDVAIHEAKE
jgi:hypothetical protein